MAKRPTNAGESDPPKPDTKRPIPINLGVTPERMGPMVPYELIGPLIEEKVGQMKAEVERSFSEQLSKIDSLPTKWQMIAGAASGVVIMLGLLFGILAYFGDRQDNAIERSATISQSLTRIEGKVDKQPTREPTRDGKASGK